MSTKHEIAPSPTLEQDPLSDELTGSFAASLSRAAHVADDSGLSLPLKQKTVKPRPVKKPSSVGAAVHAKEQHIHKRSILTNDSPHLPARRMRAKTLLNQPIPSETTLMPWKQANEFTKLASAATPLYWMARNRDWELKTFTLILNKELSDRIDNGDKTALQYIRDQLTRLIPKALGAGAEFLYGIEKAPAALADETSRRRWHLHGLIIGPAGFSATGKTPLRMALQAIKGEADSDLMFQAPGEQIERDPRHSAIRWSFYAVKNGLSVQIDPRLASAYDLPPGKQTFISARLKREAQRWHEGRIAGIPFHKLRQQAPAGLYQPIE
ncbi:MULTISPECIES: hypothetical protein [Pseudomonas]|uniref:Uncharacterized protein n=2 Tax=Pseudomonas TaxID=286 RepID=A0ABZ2JIV1_9PSED|nr:MULTISPECIES: hypothetical protein [Pseudomonas]UXH40206.1 hypothetical protein N5C08_01215 [Pseudomonas promysalinigenes]